MKDYVDFQTAVALRDAGFPQPKPGFGQVWYLEHNQKPVLIGSAEGFVTNFYDRVFAPRLGDFLFDHKDLGEINVAQRISAAVIKAYRENTPLIVDITVNERQ